MFFLFLLMFANGLSFHIQVVPRILKGCSATVSSFCGVFQNSLMVFSLLLALTLPRDFVIAPS